MSGCHLPLAECALFPLGADWEVGDVAAQLLP
jgi:hypothetical protein